MKENSKIKKYTFEPIVLRMCEVYELSKLCQNHVDDTIHTLLGIEEGDDSIECLKKMSLQQANWKTSKKQLFYVKEKGHIVGVASIMPVRETSNDMIEYTSQIWTPHKEEQFQMNEAFSKYIENYCARISDLFMKKRLFNPFQNGQLMPMVQVKFEDRSKAGDSFLKFLNQSMPKDIRTIKSGFSLHRFGTDEKLHHFGMDENAAKKVYQLFERNRIDADEFLPGYSERCKTLEKTHCFLNEFNEIRNGRTSVFYEMRFENQEVGMIWADFRGTEARLNLLVDEDAKNRGYASESIRLLERELFKRGISNIIIECREDNWRVPNVARSNRYVGISDENEHELYSYLEYAKSNEAYVKGYYSVNSRIKQTPFNRQR